VVYLDVVYSLKVNSLKVHSLKVHSLKVHSLKVNSLKVELFVFDLVDFISSLFARPVELVLVGVPRFSFLPLWAFFGFF